MQVSIIRVFKNCPRARDPGVGGGSPALWRVNASCSLSPWERRITRKSEARSELEPASEPRPRGGLALTRHRPFKASLGDAGPSGAAPGSRSRVGRMRASWRCDVAPPAASRLPTGCAESSVPGLPRAPFSPPPASAPSRGRPRRFKSRGSDGRRGARGAGLRWSRRAGGRPARR